MRWILPLLVLVILFIAPATAVVPDPRAEPATPLVASFTASPSTGSAPLEVHFTDTSTGLPTSWLWDFGDGTTSTERNPVHTYCGPGRYRVTLFAERAEPHAVASATGEITLLAGEDVAADFTAEPRSGDAPLTVRFSDLSTNATGWAWTFGDGGTSSDQNPEHTYTVPGTYTVSLRAQNPYRMDAETRVGYVSVTGPVNASFTASPRAVQVGAAVQFTDTSTGNPYTFAWDFGDGTSSTGRNPSHVYGAPGTFTVSLTAANPLHSDTRTETGYILVYDEVDASFTANVTGGQAPLPVRFEDTSSGTPTSWTWDFGDGGSSDEQHPVHTYTNPGTYDVTLTASNGYFSETTIALHRISVLPSSPAVLALPGQAEPPGDCDDDGLCEDLNANGRPDFADVVLYFNRMDWIAANEPVAAFDYNGNGGIDFGDVVRLFDRASAISTPGSTPTSMAAISGTVFQVDETGTVLGPVAGVAITLELASGDVPGFPPQGMTTTTDANGSYSFEIPEVPALFRLSETGLDPAAWTPYSPASGVIEGVIPGGSGYDFLNRYLYPDGIVIYLNRTVPQGCDGGYIVDSTTIEGEARSGDWVTINDRRYQFGNGEQFRFTVRGNQTEGQVFLEQFELKRLTLRVEFEVRNFGAAGWTVPAGFSNQTGNPTTPVNIGVPSSISIDAINRNVLNDASTLTYRYPVCAPADTRLVLDGRTRIDARNPPGDATYLEFTDLHAVHDIRYGGGLDTMWINLMPGYDYLLVQGVCVSP